MQDRQGQTRRSRNLLDPFTAPTTRPEYNSHPSIEKIKLYYENDIKNFDFQTVDADTVMLMIKNLDSKKSTSYDKIPGKLIKVAHRELATPLCNL